MKKTILKAEYKLKIFNDGTSAYTWTHAWKISNILYNKDMTLHPTWDKSDKDEKIETKTNHMENYTKTLVRKSKTS
jgi:hypothetical protein